MLHRIFAASRYIILIAVVGAFIAALAELIYGGLMAANTIYELFVHLAISDKEAKSFAVRCIEVIDLLLLGTVLYIISLGLYTLFIQKLPLPSWLIIESLDDLKKKLMSVVIVLLSVTFLSFVVSWDEKTNILSLGLGIGLVILALSVALALDHS